MTKNAILLKVYKTPTIKKISIYSIYIKIIKPNRPEPKMMHPHSKMKKKLSHYNNLGTKNKIVQKTLDNTKKLWTIQKNFGQYKKTLDNTKI